MELPYNLGVWEATEYFYYYTDYVLIVYQDEHYPWKSKYNFFCLTKLNSLDTKQKGEWASKEFRTLRLSNFQIVKVYDIASIIFLWISKSIKL